MTTATVAPLDMAALNESRGFSAGTLEKYGVHIEDDVVMIPLLARNGHVWYEREHRPGGKPKYLSPRGVQPHLYNPLGLGPHSPEVWLAEGEFDTISLIEAGAPACGVLGASSFNRHWAQLFTHARVIVAFDPDEAGKEAAAKVAALFDPSKVELFDAWPLMYEDFNDWWKGDPQGMRRVVLEW